MSETQNQPLQLSFNAFLKVDFGPWDFHVTAEKAMQSRIWLEACKLK